METKTINPEKVKNGASYVMLFLSAFGIGYSIVKYFILTDADRNWATFLPLFIVSIAVFVKNIIALRSK